MIPSTLKRSPLRRDLSLALVVKLILLLLLWLAFFRTPPQANEQDTGHVILGTSTGVPGTR
jgi:hypothetical protein